MSRGYLAIAATLLAAIIAIGGCGGQSTSDTEWQAYVQRFADALPGYLVAPDAECPAKAHVSGKVLILANQWDADQVREGHLDQGDPVAMVVSRNNFDSLRVDHPDLFAADPAEVGTLVWSFLENVEVGTYTGGTPAVRVDLHARVIDLAARCAWPAETLLGSDPMPILDPLTKDNFGTPPDVVNYVLALPRD